MTIAWFAVVALLASGVAAQAPTCTTYPLTGGVCSGFLPNPIVATADSIAANDGFLEQQGLRVLKVLLAPSPQCYAAFVSYACQSMYFACPTTTNTAATLNGVPPCLDVCQQTNQYCGDIFTRAGLQSQLPDCNSTVSHIPSGLNTPWGTDTGDASVCTPPVNVLALTNATLPATTGCPAPLVPNPDLHGPPDLKRACIGACCIGCPHLDAFFPPNKINSYLNFTDALRAISLIFSAVILISFSLLHKKRRHPLAILWWFVAAVGLFSAGIFISLGHRKTTQCADDATESTQANNPYCAVQGTLLVFSSQAMITWCVVLIANLHLTTVHNSHWFANKYAYIHTMAWGIPAVLTSVTVAFNGVAYQFGSLCFLAPDRASDFFFYPLLPFIVIGFLVHMTTVVYVARIAVQADGIGGISTTSSSNHDGQSSVGYRGESTKRRVMKIWKTSWRSIVLVGIFLVTFMFFWMFYFTQGKLGQDPKSPFIAAWIKCILSADGTQEKCSAIATPHLPNFALLVVADALPAGIGIWVFLIFGFRASLLQEWREYFAARKSRKRSTSDATLPIGVRGSILKQQHDAMHPETLVRKQGLRPAGWEDDQIDEEEEEDAERGYKMESNAPYQHHPYQQRQQQHQQPQQQQQQPQRPTYAQSPPDYPDGWSDDSTDSRADLAHTSGGRSRTGGTTANPNVNNPPHLRPIDTVGSSAYGYPMSRVQYDRAPQLSFPRAEDLSPTFRDAQFLPGGVGRPLPVHPGYGEDEIAVPPPSFVRPPPARRQQR
ncbi:hypothetical protein HKX48_009050 [Thoreauomyces humboldtii]|nr:hypothetical protein HKX48_009050 [Thoreauomyces humboldtii]